MGDKQDFLQKVLALFLENGAKTLTMDDIAKEFAISKKTLYQHYSNKDMLLEEVLDFKINQIIESISTNQNNAKNPIEKMLLRENNFKTFTKTNQSIFIKQLEKYYPTIFQKHILNMNQKISVIFLKNISEGRKYGYFREDFDEHLYIKFLLQIMLSYESSPLFENEKMDREAFCKEGMYFYLHAITTEKGKKTLYNILENVP